ncbi:MAG: LexA family protein [Acutalibacteraceae bacterium]
MRKLSDIGIRIKNLRCSLGLTQEELAEYAETTKQTIHKYETGIISNIPASKIKLMADKLHTTPAYLMGWEDDHDPLKPFAPRTTEDYTTFPVIGDVAAGYDRYAVEDWNGDTVDIPNSYLKGHDRSEFFVLKVVGDSMFPEYHDGDKVLIKRQPSMDHSGQVGVVLYNGDESTLKQVIYAQGEDWMTLAPINTAYPPKKITGADLESCRVLGVPRLLIREISD